METLQAIHTRVSAGKIADAPVPHEDLLKILNAAIRAPNHFLTNPWRFIVFGGAQRASLGAAIRDSVLELEPDMDESKQQRLYEQAFKGGTVIVVGSKADEDPQKDEENILATACAIYGAMLAAHSLGYGAYWRTGRFLKRESFKRFLGLEHEDHVLSILSLGRPEGEFSAKPRKPLEEVVVWRT
jgi:nitroreductase